MDKDNINIESYEGMDAYYESDDSEYEEFLKSVEGNTSVADDATPVLGSDETNLGETINIKGVLDMVRKKVGEVGTAAKKVRDNVKEQISDFKASANMKAEEKKAVILDSVDEISEKMQDKTMLFADDILTGVKNTKDVISDTVSGAKQKFDGLKSKNEDTEKILSGVEAVISKIDALSSRINDIEIKQIENKNAYDRDINDNKVAIMNLNSELTQIKQSTAAIARLNDSLFELKNSQQNTKKTLTELEISYVNLKKKCIAGITILSLLSAISIILEIINLLS